MRTLRIVELLTFAEKPRKPLFELSRWLASGECRITMHDALVIAQRHVFLTLPRDARCGVAISG